MPELELIKQLSLELLTLYSLLTAFIFQHLQPMAIRRLTTQMPVHPLSMFTEAGFEIFFDTDDRIENGLHPLQFKKQVRFVISTKSFEI